VATDHEPLLLPPGQDVELRIDRTVASWQRWTELIRYSGDWPEPVKRSALLLKTLLSGTSGAIAAAATTSLPERIGGDKNWDYRYSWTRDSSFTIGAFMRLGLHEEVHAAVSWLLGVMRRTGPELQVFYTLDGRVASREDDLQAPGYRGSRPVRAGNAASGQLQLGTYGDLFDTLARYAEAGHVLDPSTGRMLAEYADSCCDRWLNRDSGIWELDVTEHYTISKMGCWVALDRACRLAEAGQIPEHRAHRWRDEARDIQEWVNTNCWSDEKQAYTFYAGTDELDAAVLLAGRTGFERGDRLSTTIDAITRELVPGDGSLVHRYSGMQTEEGAFVACTFWLVDALAHCGRGDEARALMDRAVSLANDVGVLSEEIDPATGGFLGNLPQGLSHLALINAAHTLSALQDRR
jgi:GH15 family glucan-1,4-alpha-glucosidase